MNRSELAVDLLELPKQGVVRLKDRRPPTDDVRVLVVPLGVATVQHVGIPERVGVRQNRFGRSLRPQRRQHLKIELPDRALLVPVVANSLVGQQRARPAVARIARIHVEPDGVYAKLWVQLWIGQRLLRPTGGCDAGGSCRGKQQHEPDVASIVVETIAQRRRPAEFRERGRGSGVRRGRRRRQPGCGQRRPGREDQNGATHRASSQTPHF